MVPLSQLTALTELMLLQVAVCPPPASLAALSALRTLNMDSAAPVDAAELDAALPSMQQLTSLAICSLHGSPAACARLPQLERLFIVESPGQHGEQQALPLGLTSLRCLGAGWDVLARSVPVLTSMPRLQELYVGTEPDSLDAEEAAWQAFWGWAARMRRCSG